MLRLFTALCLLLAGGPALADTRIQTPVMDGGTIAAHVYMHADESGRPVAVEADSLRPWVAENLSTFSLVTFEALNRNGLAALADLPSAGFELAYDPQEAVLRAHVLPAALKTQSLSLGQAGLPPGVTPVENADLSGFLNLRGGVDYTHESAADDGRQPIRADLDGAVNLRGWVLEGQGDFLEGSDEAWRRGDFRLVRDLPDDMVRMALGDLSYPVTSFQSYVPMLGVSVARNFSLQPYRITEPTGQTSFMLTSPSRVDVLVNGQRVRTLQLEPGPYDVSDFPVSEGSNDIELLITDATGRMERKRFPLVSDQALLKAGLHEYAYNIGIRSEDVDRRIDYDADQPVFSGFHRYGFSDTLTAGASLQADEDAQQLGLSAVSAHGWGIVGLEAAASHAGDGSDGAARASYQYQDAQARRNFTAALEYQGADFAAPGAEGGDSTAWEWNWRYTQPIFYNISLGVGGRYRWMRDDADDQWSYSVNFSKTIFGALSANLSLQSRSIDGAGVFMGISWSPHESGHMLSTSVDTLTHTQDANWSWHEGRRWQAGAGVTRQDDTLRKTGHVAFSGYRGEASLYHDVTTSLADRSGGRSQDMNDRRTSFRAGTALAFADDHVALSRPINSGFIMLTRHKNLQGRSIGINPEEEEDGSRAYQARIDAVGPAILPDAVPYIYRPVKIDTQDLPDMYDIGADNFVAMPGYKSGAVVTIGNDANIYVDGYLTYADGSPAALMGGILRPDNGPAREFFTNARGRFRVSRMAPGAYAITLNDRPDLHGDLRIPEETGTGRFIAGDIALSGGVR